MFFSLYWKGDCNFTGVTGFFESLFIAEGTSTMLEEHSINPSLKRIYNNITAILYVDKHEMKDHEKIFGLKNSNIE